MKRNLFTLFLTAAVVSLLPPSSDACTGISLTAKDGSHIVARTIEWGGSFLNSQYVVVPRGYVQQSLIPDHKSGMTFTSRYGYVGAGRRAGRIRRRRSERGGAGCRSVLLSGIRQIPGV